MKVSVSYIAILLCLVWASVPLRAETEKNKEKVKVLEDHLFSQMLSGTAKVMFIDSVVVDKDSFLMHIPLNRESGTLSYDKDGKVIYLNEFGTRRFYAATDSMGDGIYAQEKIGLAFSAPVLQESLSDGLDASSYPFLMADGVTIYFSAEGERSMGGRDIFMTRYNADDGEYYQPENEGLPFNSTANDYFIAIDELDTLGWLVTDRRQPEGKVCIYTFEPTQRRYGLEDESFTDEEIQSLAQLLCIKDTWKFGNRDAAMRRLKALESRSQRQKAGLTVYFVVNDRVVYHQLADFRSPVARKQYVQLMEKKKILQKNEEQLEKWRQEYAGNHQLGSSIREAEETLQKQRHDLSEFEKEIRNIENKL